VPESARIAVIGAGAAGSALAIHLASAGVLVDLIESKPFPRAKVCGEFVSPAGTEALEALISPTDLVEAGARRIGTLSLACGRRRFRWTMPTPAWALSRRSLDAMLLQRAVSAGARVIQPERVADVEYRQDGVSLDLASGRRLEANLVIHADGSGRHDPAGPIPTVRGLVGIKCHARAPWPIEGIEMRAGPGLYGGAIAVEDGQATFALCVTPSALARSANDRDALLSTLWPEFDASMRVGDWMACGVARSRYITPGHHRSLRIGNAAAAVDPVGGEGIGLALWSAHTLARTLVQTLAAAPPRSLAMEPLRRHMAACYRRRLLTRAPACRLAAELLMRPALLGVLWPALSLPSLSVSPWYRLTGKPAAGR
jgi:flavin-dependent dehydrogenase